MIEYIKGSLASLTPATAVIETSGGVAYFLNITLPVYSALEGKAEARLYVHEAIREDAWVLFGFLNEHERELFRALVGVSGVGAMTARVILSSIPAPELEGVIASGDHARLKNVKGIGAKTAQRIIVDLKDKIKPSDGGDGNLPLQPEISNSRFDDALDALVALGFPRPASQKVLKKLFDADPAIKVEAAIKQAFSML